MTSEDSQRRSKYFPGTSVFDVFRQNNVVASTSISEKIEESKVAMLFNLLHITREFYSIKFICKNLYALFSRVKSLYSQSELRTAISHVEV